MTDIIIFSGQSNMQGQTESPMSPISVENCREYRFLDDSLVPLAHPVGENIGNQLLLAAHESHGSLIPDFCRAYSELTEREVVAVHAAKGATIVADWLEPSDRFDALIAKSRGAINAVGDELGRVHFVWLQGESDALISTSEDEYLRLMRTLRASLLARLPINDFSIIRVAKFADDDRDLPILRAQESLGKTPEFLLLTRLTGYFTLDTATWINPFARAHYNNAAMTALGCTAGRNLGLFALGKPFELELEPYEELR